MKYKSLVKLSALIFGSAVIVQPVMSAENFPINSSLYYDIGGGEVVNFPVSRNPVFNIGIGVDSAFNMPSMCDLWDGKISGDPDEYLKMVQNYAEGTLDDLGNEIVNFLVTAPATIAVAALQRALPGMYDYSQNLKAQMDISIETATKSCAAVVEDMDNGVNPWGGWISASTSTSWKNQFLSEDDGSANILDAEKNVQEDHGEQSVQWFGGERGGDTGGPIELVKDVVSSGFASAKGVTYQGENVDVSEATNTYYEIGGDDGTPVQKVDRMRALFNDSDEAAAFAVEVVGEQSIHYCDGCTEGGFTQGKGLKPIFADERDDLVRAWSKLLTDYGSEMNPPTIQALRTVSSQKVAITKPVYLALIDMPKQDRDVFVYRLISDVAVENTIEKAIAVRQMFKSGINTAEVQSYGAAKDAAYAVADQLKDEIDDFLWEISTQETLASKTSKRIIMANTLEGLSSISAIRSGVSSENSKTMSSQGPIQ